MVIRALDCLQKKEKFTQINSDYDFNSFLNIDGIGEIQISSIKKLNPNTALLIGSIGS